MEIVLDGWMVGGWMVGWWLCGKEKEKEKE